MSSTRSARKWQDADDISPIKVNKGMTSCGSQQGRSWRVRHLACIIEVTRRSQFSVSSAMEHELVLSLVSDGFLEATKVCRQLVLEVAVVRRVQQSTLCSHYSKPIASQIHILIHITKCVPLPSLSSLSPSPPARHLPR